MKRSDLFRQHTPPPGGLGRLRAAIREPAGRSPWLLRLAPLSALAAGLAVALVWVRPHAPATDILSAEPVTLLAEQASTALVRVPTSDPHVVFYWVGQIDDGP